MGRPLNPGMRTCPGVTICGCFLPANPGSRYAGLSQRAILTDFPPENRIALKA